MVNLIDSDLFPFRIPLDCRYQRSRDIMARNRGGYYIWRFQRTF